MLLMDKKVILFSDQSARHLHAYIRISSIIGVLGLTDAEATGFHTLSALSKVLCPALSLPGPGAFWFYLNG